MAARILAKVEVKFDGTNYNDISAYTRRVTINYGRAHLLEDDFQAGSCSIELDNTGGEFTPGHPGASYGDSQLINREVRISTEVVGGSDSYATYLWRGRIADVDYIAQQSTSTVYLRTVDGFDKLAKAQILSQAFSAQYTGLRIANVLDLASVDYPDESSPDDRDIDLGFVYLTAASGVTSTALDYLQKIARSEGGRFLVNHAGAPSATNFGGVLQFYARNASTDDMGITVSDAVTLGAGSVEAAGLNLEWGSELLFNSFQWTDSAGGVQTGSNAASITKYRWSSRSTQRPPPTPRSCSTSTSTPPSTSPTSRRGRPPRSRAPTSSRESPSTSVSGTCQPTPPASEPPTRPAPPTPPATGSWTTQPSPSFPPFSPRPGSTPPPGDSTTRTGESSPPNSARSPLS